MRLSFFYCIQQLLSIFFTKLLFDHCYLNHYSEGILKNFDRRKTKVVDANTKANMKKINSTRKTK